MKGFITYTTEQLDVPVLTPAQIAVHHGVKLSQITSQLKMGIKIEQEHTTNLKAARRIALAHLKEKPDYYTKLKQVEK